MRGFTLIEVCVVVAIAGILASIGMVGMGEMTRAARVNSQLAMVDVEVREARALALERRVAFFVKPASTGITIGTGTCSDPDTCLPVGGVREVALPDLTVTGDTLAFNSDGRPPLSEAKTLKLGDGRELELGGAGTFRWVGGGELQDRIDGKADIRLSAQEVAKQ
jgi:prepilin-type N-terminal cleavage/methylation domain-containing protein